LKGLSYSKSKDFKHKNNGKEEDTKMAGNNSTVDGMGFEEANQASFTDVISGANIYATSAITAGATITGGDLVSNDAITDGDGQLRTVTIGSPVTTGGRIHVGRGIFGEGSTAVVNFGIEFAEKPFMTVSYVNNTSSAGAISTSGISVSGCTVYGDTTSATFDFIAVSI